MNTFNKYFSGISKLFPILREAVKPAYYADGQSPKARVSRNNTKATQKGAIHKKGKHFLGRKILVANPAQYRRSHMGLPVWKRALLASAKVEARDGS